jgi:hypothetical protein
VETELIQKDGEKDGETEKLCFSDALGSVTSIVVTARNEYDDFGV